MQGTHLTMLLQCTANKRELSKKQQQQSDEDSIDDGLLHERLLELFKTDKPKLAELIRLEQDEQDEQDEQGQLNKQLRKK